MFIIGSCKALNISYSGCCVTHLSETCKNEDCYCDQQCYSNKDCCSDIADINCHQKGSRGKTKSDDDIIN